MRSLLQARAHVCRGTTRSARHLAFRLAEGVCLALASPGRRLLVRIPGFSACLHDLGTCIGRQPCVPIAFWRATRDRQLSPSRPSSLTCTSPFSSTVITPPCDACNSRLTDPPSRFKVAHPVSSPRSDPVPGQGRDCARIRSHPERGSEFPHLRLRVLGVMGIIRRMHIARPWPFYTCRCRRKWSPPSQVRFPTQYAHRPYHASCGTAR